MQEITLETKKIKFWGLGFITYCYHCALSTFLVFKYLLTFDKINREIIAAGIIEITDE